MDEASQHVIQFLTAMKDILQGPALYGNDGLWSRLGRRRVNPGFRPATRVSIFGQETPAFAFGVYAEIAGGKALEFEIEVFGHHTHGWQINTSVQINDDGPYGGMRTLRAFPTRCAQTLDECLNELRAAAADLATCEDVLDDLPETRSRN